MFHLEIGTSSSRLSSHLHSSMDLHSASLSAVVILFKLYRVMSQFFNINLSLSVCLSVYRCIIYVFCWFFTQRIPNNRFRRCKYFRDTKGLAVKYSLDGLTGNDGTLLFINSTTTVYTQSSKACLKSLPAMQLQGTGLDNPEACISSGSHFSGQ